MTNLLEETNINVLYEVVRHIKLSCLNRTGEIEGVLAKLFTVKREIFILQMEWYDCLVQRLI